MKSIAVYPNYFITEGGQVLANKTGIWKKFSFDRDGYLISSLSKNGKKKMFRLHQLVAKAFIPNPLSKETVNHIDGNKLNNHVSNLEWNTREENNKHAYRTGLKDSVGAANGNSKLNEEDVFGIIELRDDGMSQESIGRMFKITQVAVSDILLGKRWSYLTGIQYNKIKQNE